MAEYLTPGVYVEEFDSGAVSVAGVSTSTAGFTGVTEKGPHKGAPVLVTSYSNFRRVFGGNLSESEFGEYRYLSYAVNQFFINGGSRCYIKRVTPADAAFASNVNDSAPYGTESPVKPAEAGTPAKADAEVSEAVSGKEDGSASDSPAASEGSGASNAYDAQSTQAGSPAAAPSAVSAASAGASASAPSPLIVYAKNPGVWGNNITLFITPASKAKTQILEITKTNSTVKFRLKNPSGFSAGDIVALDDKGKKKYNRVISVDGDMATFEEPFDESAVDTGLIPEKALYTCEVNIEVKCESIVEKYENCSFNETSANFINQKLAKSELIAAEARAADEIADPFALISGQDSGEFLIGLSGGSNGTLSALSSADFIGEDNGPGDRSGIQAFIDNDEVSVMAVPGVTDPQVQLTLTAHCERMTNRFAVLDVPRDKRTVDDIIGHRNFFDTDYAAMYHPWVKILDPLTKNTAAIPPSGSVCGIFARTDSTRGVHKAPANEVVSACVGLDCNYTDGEQDILNPKGVNLIRSFPGQGIRVWGARTLSSNALWKYVNVRRLFIFVEESIRTSTNWVVFEPNDQLLWLRVRRTIEIFLGDVWRTGALVGATEDEAFFVNIGPDTMTQGDIDAGRLICVIGIAPVKPAEFVIFRITQKTGDAE